MKKRLVYCVMTTIMICSFIISNGKVFAVNDFYSSNDINFYDSNTTDDCTINGTGSGNLVGNENTEKALRFLVGKGLALIQASGVAGNLQAESSINPARIQGTGTQIADNNYTLVDGVGFGIAQWTSGGRQQGLVNLSKSSNLKITDLSLQLDYLWKELSGNYKGALSDLKKTDNPVDAAVAFHNGYEKSADSVERVKAVRGGIAQQIYDKYKTTIPDETTKNKKSKTSKKTTNKTSSTDSVVTTTTEPTSTINCTGDGKASAFVDGFPIYNQFDSQWADLPLNATNPDGKTFIGNLGCGPAAIAMIITALTGQTVTPIKTAALGVAHGAYIAGKGTDYHIVEAAKDYGLNISNIPADVAQINEVLRNKGLIMLSGSGGTPFVADGHWIVIRAINSNNKWLIGDSNGNKGIENSANTSEFDPATLLNSGTDKGNIWAVTK